MNREKLLNFKNGALAIIAEAQDKDELENLRIEYLSRKGKINQLLAKVPQLKPEERKQYGTLVNEIKAVLQEAIKSKQPTINDQQLAIKEWFDITAPGRKPPSGHLHLVTQAIEEITHLFEKIGFTHVHYPEVEWDWYAFEGLNMPPNHPARDDWETFFVEAHPHPQFGQMILTPHTSSGQLREMKRRKPPLRMLNIAKCYRRQADVSHAPMFYQFEGLVVDQDITIPHLKGTLDYFVRQYFGPKRKSRIRPFHFQFTEPSFEVDVTCDLCQGQARPPDGQGCRFCKEGWLELGGAGMVHPVVLRNGGIDPQKYTGFAFGWGVERVLMMKAGLKLSDLRILYQNDLRFLKQF